MRVRCLKLEKLPDIAWLTEGREYVVLSVLTDNKTIMYRLIGDDERIPAIYDSKLFVVVSSYLPTNWIIDFQSNYFELAPRPWTQPGFWESYFDDEKESVKIFKEERTKILASEDEQMWPHDELLEKRKVWNNDSIWLTDWYNKQRRSGWDQDNGVQIGTLEIPGWFLKVNLKKTDLENKKFDVVDMENSATDWIVCSVKNDLFEGFCGPENLSKLIEIFKKWAEAESNRLLAIT